MFSKSSFVAIVDDDEIFQMLIKKILEKGIDGASILQFLDGFTALSYFTQHTTSTHMLPRIIFLDVNMPAMDGWQFLKKLENLQFSTPYKPAVFIISGVESIDFEELKAYTLIKGYLTKPIVPATLINIIHSHMQDNPDLAN